VKTGAAMHNAITLIPVWSVGKIPIRERLDSYALVAINSG
jgi:hypothetical protein